MMPYITVRENKAKWWITVQGLNYNEVSTAWSLELQTKVKRRFVITEKAPTWAFSWLKAPTSAFTFKTLLRHYALTPR